VQSHRRKCGRLIDPNLADHPRRLAVQHVARVETWTVLADERALLAYAAHEIGAKTGRHVGIEEHLTVRNYQRQRFVNGDDVYRAVKSLGQ
jgi:hypothetical protein